MEELPQDLSAEMAVLGSIMVNNKVIDEVMELVDPEHFTRIPHAIIFKSMMEMRASGIPIDAVTLKDYLKSKKKLTECGGAAYLLDLTDGCTSSANAMRYAEQVRGYFKLRQIVSIGTEIKSLGYSASVDEVDDLIGKAMSMTTALSMTDRSNAMTTEDILDDVIKQIHSGQKSYFSPPHHPEVLLEGGDLLVLAAGTSVGKTGVALDWCDEWSKTKQVTYFEYEMSEASMMHRLLAKYAGVTTDELRKGEFEDADALDRLEDAVVELRSRKLKIAEVWCKNTTLFARIRREAQQGSKIVVIDHLGLIPFAESKSNDAKAIGKYITNPLKRLASELNITIVLLVQLNREGQKGGFPQLYHLRDSGEIEQDASVVIMLWGEKSIKDELTTRIRIREDSGILSDDEIQRFDDFWLIRSCVEKNRNGAIGATKWCKFEGKNFRYIYPNEITQVVYDDRPLFGNGE